MPALPTGRSLARLALVAGLAFFVILAGPAPAFAAGESGLVLPDLNSQTFMGFISGWWLLFLGMLVCVAGLGFGAWSFITLQKLPVHKAMRDVSELIYETCKTYLLRQGVFLLLLLLFVGGIMLWYFGFLTTHEPGENVPLKVFLILLFSVIGMAGSYGVAWFGVRVNTFANSRTAFASLRGKPYPTLQIPLQAGMSIGMALISVELILMLFVMLFLPATYAGPCFIGFAIGESLGAAALRIAGGIFTKIADIGSDLMKVIFDIKEDDARNPGVIADCTGDNAGDSVGPTADGFETYGVTGVALITLILLAVADKGVQVQLLVWIFALRIMMILTSAGSYLLNELWTAKNYANADKMDFEQPLTNLVWITSAISIAVTYVVSLLLIPTLGDGTLWWKLATIISCGTLAGALIPELVKAFTSMQSGHVREVLAASKEGGASLNILSGLVAGNYSAYWIGLSIISLMTIGYVVGTHGVESLMIKGGAAACASVFAFGLIAFGFLGMGPVTIAVDSYGPVTDNAQSIYELSTIETIPNIKEDIHKEFGFEPQFEKGKEFLEENDGAGNTFKATAKPVLIGTAVVGATALVFSIILTLAEQTNKAAGTDIGLLAVASNLSILHAPFLLGLIAGGAVIYWFSGAATQAVTTGAYRAVEYIRANIKLSTDAGAKASTEDSKKVVGICTEYAQRGMLNIFLAVFCTTLAFAFVDNYFFIGYLISISIFGLYQAIFMANAGGAWDNAKKLVETTMKDAKGTELHKATVVGDTVGDPFKDTASVAINPVIKFSTLFGLLALDLALTFTTGFRWGLFAFFFAVALFFVWQSFYGMRIQAEKAA
jgi:K(+)-stimulated pyrophosphate-energized sodium pump